jgi:hypothetical protein
MYGPCERNALLFRHASGEGDRQLPAGRGAATIMRSVDPAPVSTLATEVRGPWARTRRTPVRAPCHSSGAPSKNKKKEPMVPQFMIAAASSIAVLAVSATAFAQQYGTADEAKAMLMKAVAAVKADKAKALDMFNKGEGGFLDRDLYVFCDNLSDAKIVVVGSPNAKQYIGTDVRTEKDAIGKVIGPEILAGMQKPEGQITEVSYMFPRPGADKTPVQKVSLVTRVSDDLGCGVGYYK